MREEQIKRMVEEGKISPQEGERLLQALEKSRSGEVDREIARQAGKKEKEWRKLFTFLAVPIAVVLVAGLALGLFFGLRTTESATELLKNGETAFAQGDYEKAIEYYRASLKKQPQSSVGYNLLGMGYRFQFNQTHSADLKNKEIEAFRKAIELDPGSFVPLVNLGATLYGMGQKKEAASLLQKALEIYPANPERATLEQMIREGKQ